MAPHRPSCVSHRRGLPLGKKAFLRRLVGSKVDSPSWWRGKVGLFLFGALAASGRARGLPLQAVGLVCAWRSPACTSAEL